MRLEESRDALIVDVASEAETEALGRALAGWIAPGTVIGLVGPLGAGKTRLARAIAEALGVEPSAIASPTFVLIHEYAGVIPVYHFDTYRLSGPEEFEALGASDYYDAGGLCLVEWADRVAGLLPPDAWRIEIEPRDGGRRFRLAVPEPARLAERLARP